MIFFLFVFEPPFQKCPGLIPGSVTQELLLMVLRGLYERLVIEFSLILYKANTLLSVLLLQPSLTFSLLL